MSGYDVDLDATVGALTDGLLILRYLFQFTGAVLTQGALGPGAQRTDPAAIVAHLDCLRATLLDPDGNGRSRTVDRRAPSAALLLRLPWTFVDHGGGGSRLHALRCAGDRDVHSRRALLMAAALVMAPISTSNEM